MTLVVEVVVDVLELAARLRFGGLPATVTVIVRVSVSVEVAVLVMVLVATIV